jgi:Protein of unknown function (DUF2723)
MCNPPETGASVMAGISESNTPSAQDSEKFRRLPDLSLLRNSRKTGRGAIECEATFMESSFIAWWRETAPFALLTCLLVATRVAFRSRYLYDIDSVNFALGLRRFDPSSYQPHPPGYFLYICLGRSVDAFLHDANAAFVAISIAASCGALATIYVLADDWFGRQAAFFAGLIFLFSPLGWFHGTVALTYAVEAFFSALTGYLCWRLICGSSQLVVPTAIIVGLAAGFRPSFLLFLSPLMLFALGGMSRKRIMGGAAILALTVLAWGVPMVWQSGGMGTWWSALLSLWRMVPGKQTVFNSSIANSIARVFSIAGVYALCFGCAALLTFSLGRAARGIDRRKKIFTWVWIAPGLMFFALIFFKFVNSGYLLVISPPVFVWLGLCASRWYAGLRVKKAVRIALVAGFAAVNTLIFLYAPLYCSYASVRHFEAELRNVLISIPQIASPADTLIVGFDSHFLGYRHAGYYLPAWVVAQYPEVRLGAGMRVFVMEQGDTQLAAVFPAKRFRNFLFFPLPPDDAEYSDYMVRVRARFPKNALRTVTAGGREFSFGAITDLALLFPVAANQVYPAQDVVDNPVAVSLRSDRPKNRQ